MPKYIDQHGNFKFNNSSSPSSSMNSPPTSVIEISDSSSNSMISLPRNHIFVVNLSPIIRHCSEKKSSSSSIQTISKGSFDAAVQKPSADDGEVKKSSSWVKSRLLGTGGYGSVYLATSKDETEKTERAIKSAELLKASTLMDEERILRRLQSPFVIGCYGHEIVREGTCHQYNLILEYCSGQSLADLMLDNHGGLPEVDVKLFARDILSGLSYIHDQNIIHCDIKPDNLLLSPVDRRVRSNGYLTKIADFGLALEKGSIEYGDGWGHKRGTRRYMAPELVSHGVVEFGVDIWAFGCTILEMLTGKQVWGEHGDLDKVDWVNLIGHSGLIPQIPSWLSKEAQDFMRKCLVKQPGLRWRIVALMNHPFLDLDA